jgi:DNA repair protein RadA/Sms
MHVDQIGVAAEKHHPTGIQEFDRVIGGGFVEGSIGICSGPPGQGKSTLMFQALDGLSKQGMSTLYVTGEESASQIASRARRLGLSGTQVRIYAETQLDKIIHTIQAESPFAVVIDSIQCVYTPELSSAPGSAAQVRECAAHLTRLAKSLGTTITLIGHVTKDGTVAGPQVLMHMVDWVAELTSESDSVYRLMRSTKNRFGALDLGVMYLGPTGMQSVVNPSAIFLSNHNTPVPGSCVVATMEGTRPLLVEVQALLDAGGPSPRRLCVGLERDRLAMLLAVLHRHAGIACMDQDVFVNAVGGVKLCEPAADLALLLAVDSSMHGKPLPRGLVSFGEIGLAGEIRPAARGQERLREAAQLGFTTALVPEGNKPKRPIPGLTVVPVHRVDQALAAIRQM